MKWLLFFTLSMVYYSLLLWSTRVNGLQAKQKMQRLLFFTLSMLYYGWCLWSTVYDLWYSQWSM